MQHFTELSINLKAYPFKERDKIVVFLTENQGKITGIAKGGVHSKRFGGTLDFLSCSRIHYVQKDSSEMVRIDEATTHHEFSNIHKDFDKLSAASLAAEICLKLIESGNPNREHFVILSNFLFQLDSGMDALKAVNAYLCKSFRSFGYPPSLLRCVQCEKPAHEAVAMGVMSWSSSSGGMLCSNCTKTVEIPLEADLLLYFSELTSASFQKIRESAGDDKKMFRLLNDFLHHHVPGLPAEGLNSLRVFSSSISY